MDYNFAATETEDRLAPLEKRIAPSVADWLKAMYYADFIFTVHNSTPESSRTLTAVNSFSFVFSTIRKSTTNTP